MISGAAGGQVISLLAAPILTRLYSPDQFGIMSVYIALLTIFVVIASLRYEMAIPLAESDEEALNLIAVCFVVLCGTTLFIAVCALTFPEPIIEDLWPTPIHWLQVLGYRILTIIGFFCLGVYYIALYLATRQSGYGAIARMRLLQGAAGPGAQIGLALTGFGAPGLIIGSIIGQTAGSFGLLIDQLRRFPLRLRAVSVERMKQTARRYRRFPLISSWAALIDAAGGNQLLYLIVAVQYSPRAAGFLFLAERVVGRPLAIIGTSVLQVYLGEAGRTVSADPARLRRRFYQVVSRQGILAFVWISSANLAALHLFGLAFGQEWTDAIDYLQAVSLAYFAQASMQPVFHTLQILQRQGIAALWQVSRLILIVSAFVVADHFGLDGPAAIFGYSLIQAFSCAALFVVMACAIQTIQSRDPRSR